MELCGSIGLGVNIFPVGDSIGLWSNLAGVIYFLSSTISSVYDGLF